MRTLFNFQQILILLMLSHSASASPHALKNPMTQWPSLRPIRSQTSPDVQAAAVRGMLARLLSSNQSENFRIIVDPTLTYKGRDMFIVESVDDNTIRHSSPSITKIQIKGNSGVAAAWGFHYFAKTFCGCHFSWSGDQVRTLPTPLPRLTQPIKVVANDLFRYYQNACTPSYSFVWWNWTRWEREIDLMALNGINLPLAATGQEEIFRRVFLALGFVQEELDDFFTGPAFLAWGRMGNIDGWGGPLPESWYSDQLALQHQILTRMRELGMTPVLPAFSGHVPRAIHNHFPNASVTRLSDWGHFDEAYCCTYLLDPHDPWFQGIGRSLILEQMIEFGGTDHVYSCDTFNENTPSSSDPVYIASIGRAIFESMVSVDRDAVWLMQGWMFRDSEFWNTTTAAALLTSVPFGRMIVLDLQSEATPQYPRLDSYFGQPWIWCMLHNFGGVKGLYGMAENVNVGPFQGRTFPNSAMVGTGIVPEGIDQNDVMYELMNDMAYLRTPADLQTWFPDFARRRYGARDAAAASAWRTLAQTAYNCTFILEFHGAYVLTDRPSFGLQSHLCYDVAAFFKAWDFMVEASNSSTAISGSDLFQHDLVDVSREALVAVSSGIYAKMSSAYHRKDAGQFLEWSSTFLDLLRDLETLLASDRRFLLGVWLESAKARGRNASEMALYEYNARNQITLWGPKGEHVDYATKQWSGVVGDYYARRWQLFVDAVHASLANGTVFNQTLFHDDVFKQVERPFTFDTLEYPTTALGDPNVIAQHLHAKWRKESIQLDYPSSF